MCEGAGIVRGEYNRHRLWICKREDIVFSGETGGWFWIKYPQKVLTGHWYVKEPTTSK